MKSRIHSLLLMLLFAAVAQAKPIKQDPLQTNSSLFVGYWGGYFDRTFSLPLNATPPYVNVVPLAFGCPMEDTLTLKFLCSQYTEDEVIAAVQQLQANGQKVILSLIDTPSTNWDQIDLVAFANSVKDIAIDEWGLDGIDIDAESSMASQDYVPAFIELVTEIRKAIGPDKILTYTCYTGSQEDQQILGATKQYLSGVNLMAYGLPQTEMISLFQTYAQWFDPSRITIGVQTGVTPLDEVASLTRWQPAGGSKGGMMLWTLSEDNPVVTGQPDQTWTKTIEANMP